MRSWVLTVGLVACGDVSAPPDDVPADTEATTDTEPAVAAPDARPRPTHRLSAVEIRRTIDAVLGVDVDVATFLPPDALVHGFDHDDVQTGLTPAFLERHADLVAEVVDRVLAREEIVPAETPVTTIGAEALDWTDGVVGSPWLIDAAWWVLQGDGFATASLDVPDGGPWDAELVAVVAPPGDGTVRLRVSVDGALLLDTTRDTWAGPDAVSPSEALPLGELVPGPHDVEVRVTYRGTPPVTPWVPGLGLLVPAPPFVALDGIELVGPSTPARTVPGAARARLLVCTPDVADPVPCLTSILRPVTRRLWRREPTDAEVARLVGLASDVLGDAGDVDAAVGAALQAVLLSPSFLFRLDVDDGARDEDGRPLRAYEVATRLAFAAWGRPPDDPLLDCAAADELRDDDGACGVRAQLERLLASPEADALVDRFLASWLGVSLFDAVSFNATVAPLWGQELVDALRGEHRALAGEILRGDADLRDLLDADHAWLRFPLDALYGVDPVGWLPRPVRLDPDERSGILTQGVVLASASLSGSPVQRGAWVTRTLLCTEPPRPPSSVPPAPPLMPGDDPNALFDRHLTDPLCQGCHASFEPYGRVLALYGSIGERRRDAAGVAQRVETTLPTGEVVRTAGDLGAALRADPRFASCAAERMLQWSLGTAAVDADTVARVRTAAEADGFSAAALLRAVVTDPTFLETTP